MRTSQQKNTVLASLWASVFVTAWPASADFWQKTCLHNADKSRLNPVHNARSDETHQEYEWSYAHNQKRTSQSEFVRHRQYDKNRCESARPVCACLLAPCRPRSAHVAG